MSEDNVNKGGRRNHSNHKDGSPLYLEKGLSSDTYMNNMSFDQPNHKLEPLSKALRHQKSDMMIQRRKRSEDLNPQVLSLTHKFNKNAKLKSKFNYEASLDWQD